MIELERHIEILLLNNDCVIVPGFGGFMAHHVDAVYDERDGVYIPPRRTLGFNPQLQLNDSLLAQSYIEAYDMSYPEAIRRIESEVAELRSHLSNKGRYELTDIGVIYVNDEGKYAFEPCESGILTPSLYGLSSFNFDLVEKQAAKPQARIVDIHQDKQALQAKQVETETKAETICINKALLRNVAAACLLAIVIFLFPGQVNTPEAGSPVRSHIDTGMLKRMMPKDITTGSNVVKERIQAIKDSTATAAKEQAEDETTQPVYCIVLASQVSLKNANAYVERLHESGYMQAEVLQREGQNTKVIYGHFTSEKEAYNALNRLHNKAEFADGWVLKIKS